MEILLIIIIILIILFVINYFTKKKNIVEIEEEIQSPKSDYSKKSIEILEKYFGNKNFDVNTNKLDFQNKLDIKKTYKKELETIVKNALHKIDVHYKFSINSNKPYTDLTTLKLVSNEVLDYCIKNDIILKKAIIFNFLLSNNSSIKEKLEKPLDDKEYLEFFYSHLQEFTNTYDKKINA